MPALNPPSMQIGALPPGFTPFQSVGPALAPGVLYTPPSIVQIVAGFTTGAAQPASASLTIAATALGSTLVAFLVGLAQGGAQNIPVPSAPAGFAAYTGTQGQTGSVIACSAAVLPPANNPGGITTVTWGTLTNWSSAAMFVYEVANLNAPAAPLAAGQALSTSATAVSPFSAQAPGLGAAVILAALFCNSAQTIGNASTPSGYTGTAIQTSTNTQASVVNTSAQGVSLITSAQGATNIQPRASVGGATAVGSVGIILTSLASGATGQSGDHAIQVENGGVYAFGGAGNAGWALGGTKPGGAGSGQ